MNPYFLQFCLVIGVKLVLDWAFNKPGQPPTLDFHDWRSLTFWTFWVAMLLCFCVGFIPKRKSATPG